MFQDRSARLKQTSHSDFAYPNPISTSQISRYQRVSPRHFTEPNRTSARTRVDVPPGTRFSSVSWPKNALEKYGLHGYQSTCSRPPLQMMLDHPFRGRRGYFDFRTPHTGVSLGKCRLFKTREFFGNCFPQTFRQPP